MSGSQHNEGLLPNGLHKPTIEFMLVLFEAMRTQQKDRVGSVILASDQDDDEGGAMVEAVIALATMSACADVVENAEGIPGSVVEEGLKKRPLVLANRKAEQEGKARILGQIRKHGDGAHKRH